MMELFKKSSLQILGIQLNLFFDAMCFINQNYLSLRKEK